MQRRDTEVKEKLRGVEYSSVDFPFRGDWEVTRSVREEKTSILVSSLSPSLLFCVHPTI